MYLITKNKIQEKSLYMAFKFSTATQTEKLVETKNRRLENTPIPEKPKCDVSKCELGALLVQTGTHFKESQ